MRSGLFRIKTQKGEADRWGKASGTGGGCSDGVRIPVAPAEEPTEVQSSRRTTHMSKDPSSSASPQGSLLVVPSLFYSEADWLREMPPGLGESRFTTGARLTLPVADVKRRGRQWL
ncbi:hypothetical protein AAFF_G00291790 [Aldrovandia affinis]|uniref:Uncharacterized protein n=1 Tax=Aldrovandia affinis TaxID=143900 RepID=A0AAD7WS14_9TELE|nr:hypothetical protein AAFF_G00291790 [Aldrovandia affinis]